MQHRDETDVYSTYEPWGTASFHGIHTREDAIRMWREHWRRESERAATIASTPDCDIRVVWTHPDCSCHGRKK